MRNENYVIATLLDPRVKTGIFGSKCLFTRHDGFSSVNFNPSWFENVRILGPNIPERINGLIPLKEHAIAGLKSIIELKGIQDQRASQNRPSTSLSQQSSSSNGLFDLVDEDDGTGTVELTIEDELNAYLKGKKVEVNPLSFWKDNEHRYPTLSKLAEHYLAVPASSASIERLFSVAGCIARARRSRLSVKTVEMLLTYQKYLDNRRKQYAFHSWVDDCVCVCCCYDYKTISYIQDISTVVHGFQLTILFIK